MEWVSQPEEAWWYSSSRVKYENADTFKLVNTCFFYYQLSCRWFSWLIAWFINCQKKVKKMNVHRNFPRSQVNTMAWPTVQNQSKIFSFWSYKTKNSFIHISGFVAFLHRFPSTSKNWLSHHKLPGTFTIWLCCLSAVIGSV